MEALDIVKGWLGGESKKEKIKNLKKQDSEISARLKKQFEELETALAERKHD